MEDLGRPLVRPAGEPSLGGLGAIDHASEMLNAFPGECSVTDQLGQASAQLGPFADTIHVVKYLLLGIAAVSIALTLYAVWHRAKIKEATG